MHRYCVLDMRAQTWDPDAVCAATHTKNVSVDLMLCRLAVDWYGLLNAITSRQHYDDQWRMLAVLSILLTKQNACFMPNVAYQPKSSHFHKGSSEKMLSWTDRFKQLGLIASNCFNKREMILHSDFYVAKLSKMGGLCFCQMQKTFYLISLVIMYTKIFKSWSWRHARASHVHDQVETVLEICKDFMKLELEIGYSSYFCNHTAKVFATRWLLISLFTTS